jgi:hypothetical protein
MDLKALSSCCSEITLPMLTTQVIQETVKLWGKLTSRLLQPEHELEVFVAAFDLAV